MLFSINITGSALEQRTGIPVQYFSAAFGCNPKEISHSLSHRGTTSVCTYPSFITERQEEPQENPSHNQLPSKGTHKLYLALSHLNTSCCCGHDAQQQQNRKHKACGSWKEAQLVLNAFKFFIIFSYFAIWLVFFISIQAESKSVSNEKSAQKTLSSSLVESNAFWSLHLLCTLKNTTLFTHFFTVWLVSLMNVLIYLPLAENESLWNDLFSSSSALFFHCPTMHNVKHIFQCH